MAVKLIDLQLIYGVAGARDKFEDLASQLVEGEQLDVDKVRIKQGDCGIDVFVGDITDPDGIDVYQCKFFPMGIDDTQKEQIRKSFRTCRDSKEFKTKSWTVCLPVDLSIDEKKWFADWRAKQASSGIMIGDPWGAMKLEGLLYQAKNRGLKESFFKEEYLTQIRDLHRMMATLLADLAGRMSESESAKRDERLAAETAKQEEYVSTFTQEAREKHAFLIKLPPVKFSEIQKARRAGHSHSSEVIRRARRQRGAFELAIHPAGNFQTNRFSSITHCWECLQTRQLGMGNYQIPGINHQARESGTDWAGSHNVIGQYSDIWRLSLRGVFVYYTYIFSDAMLLNELEEASKHKYLNFTLPPPTLDVKEAVSLLTLMFIFAGRYAAVLPDEESLHLDITFHNTQSRVLVDSRAPLSFRGEYSCTLNILTNRWTLSRKELEGDPKHLAVKAAVWFFERFNWPYVDETVVRRFQ